MNVVPSDRVTDLNFEQIYGGVGGTIAFLGEAIKNCILAGTGDYSSISTCGGYALAVIFTAMATTRGYRGMVQEAVRQGAGGGARLLPQEEGADYFANLLGLDDGPQVFEEDGHTVTLTRIAGLSSRSNDAIDTWLHFSMQDVDQKTGWVQDAIIDMDTLTNASTVSTVPVFMQNDLHRRQELADYTFYYSWDEWDNNAAEQFPRTQESHETLARDVWTWMVGADAEEFCMALALPDFNGIPQAVNTGYLSFISGRFSDRKASC
jgi:hypothetical protein